jgi:subtilisin family serine protease
MRISVKSYVLPALVIVCLLCSWQSVGANSGSYEDDSTASQDISETIVTGSGYPESAHPVLGMVQDTLKQNTEQEWLSGLASSLQPPDTSGIGAPIIVAVLDTGIDKDHEDLSGTVMAEINLTDSPTADDIHGHGTHIAGIIAAVNDNNLGINGIAPESQLLNIKVADDRGSCRMSALVEGIYRAVAAGADIINISIEMAGPSPELEAAINHAWENGVVVIAAAGNDDNNLPVYPAYYENCIGVTALRDNGELAPLANFGDWVDAAAPGFDIYSTLPGNDYGYKHGTSFAAAYVSGLAARLLPLVETSNGDGRLNDEIRQVIIDLCGYDAAQPTG